MKFLFTIYHHILFMFYVYRHLSIMRNLNFPEFCSLLKIIHKLLTTVSFATIPSKSGWYSWTCPLVVERPRYSVMVLSSVPTKCTPKTHRTSNVPIPIYLCWFLDTLWTQLSHYGRSILQLAYYWVCPW